VIVFSRRILPIPGTVTTPSTTINARIGDQPPSATSTTDSGTHVVIQTDGQQLLTDTLRTSRVTRVTLVRKPQSCRRSANKYDEEFRAGAVRIVSETGKPIAAIARDLCVNPGTLG